MEIVAREIINVCEGFYRGKQSVTLVEKVKYEDGSIKKLATFQPDPNFHYYVSKKPLPVYQTIVQMDQVRKVECKYSQLLESIACETGNEEEYARNEGKWKKLKRLHYNKDVHFSDVNISDYIIAEYQKKHEKILAPFEVEKAFFDIEVDGYDYDGFPRADIAPCPINFISYVNRANKSLKLFVLLNEKNKSQQKFIEENQGSCTNLWTNTNNTWCANAIPAYFTDEKNPSNSMESLTIYWFKSELNLIKKFYDTVHKEKPDFLCGK
jgi:hypothetical protein